MFEDGTVDAAEWSTPAENIVLGLHEMAPFIVVPGIHQPTVAFDFIMPADKWDALPEDIKLQIEAAAKLTTFESFHRWVMRDLEALEQLRTGKAELIKLDQAYLDAWKKAGREWAEMQAEENEWVRRIADSYYGFIDRWEESIQMHINQRR